MEYRRRQHCKPLQKHMEGNVPLSYTFFLIRSIHLIMKHFIEQVQRTSREVKYMVRIYIHNKKNACTNSHFMLVNPLHKREFIRISITTICVDFYLTEWIFQKTQHLTQNASRPMKAYKNLENFRLNLFHRMRQKPLMRTFRSLKPFLNSNNWCMNIKFC